VSGKPGSRSVLAAQRRRSIAVAEAPRGFRYKPDFLSLEEERELLVECPPNLDPSVSLG